MNQRSDQPMTEAPPLPSGGRAINRRNMLKGVGGVAALVAMGAGASVGASAPAQAAGLNIVEYQDGGRMQ